MPVSALSTTPTATVMSSTGPRRWAHAKNMVRIRPLQDADEAEWLRLRFALWPDYTLPDMLAEMAVLRLDLEHQPFFVAECPYGGLCGLMEVAIHTSAPGCHSE